MSEDLRRICDSCGSANAMDVHFCGTCAAPLTSTALARRDSALPAPWEPKRAALALGVTAVALRVGTTIVKEVAHRVLTRLTDGEPEPAPLAPAEEQPRRSVLHIKRFWFAGDASGRRQWGSEDITVYDE